MFVVPRFRLGPMGFLPRLLLNDTSSIIKDSTSFQVRLFYTVVLSNVSYVCKRNQFFRVFPVFRSMLIKIYMAGLGYSSPKDPVKIG